MVRVTDERAAWLGKHILPHKSALHAWLSRRNLGGLDPDDVIQEAFAKLITLSSVVDIRNPRNYLYQVARSIVASHFRSQKVVVITLADMDALDSHVHAPSTETQVSDREELQRLAEGIALLPEPTRTIFRLRRVDQISQRAIAEQLHMPESTVEKHMSRAILSMSKLLGRGGSRRLDASITDGPGEMAKHEADRKRD